MHALYLPGNSPENHDVTHELAGRVSGFFESSTILEYPHWSSKNPHEGVIDLDEASEDLIASFAKKDKDFVVIAKSIGVNLCLRAQTISAFFSPQEVVFMGAPFNKEMRKYNPVDGWLKDYKTPSLWLQNGNDSVIPAEELQKYLEGAGLPEVNLIGLDGKGHQYEPQAIAEIVNQYLELDSSQ